MRWLWLIFGVLMVGAIVVLWQESAPKRHRAPGPAEAPGMRDRSPVRPVSETGGAPALARPSAASPVDGAGGGSETPAAGAPARPGAGSATANSATDASPSKPDRPLPKIEGAQVVHSTLERLESGALVADRRFRILGSGTASDPYQVSWECLASAQETYVPRLGETILPERIAMLDGKIVRMEGYVTFPLLMKEAKELILMLNQWDGCCIGVPPTPYDAIEVKLDAPIQNTRRHASFTYGSVTGRFKVEPFLVENWLVGLYVMEDAIFQPGEL